MIPTRSFDLPPEKANVLRKAQRLEVWTLVYLVSAAIAVGLTMGGSQAMRTSFFEDSFSVLPAIAFLICSRMARRAPNRDFPYGYHGCVSLGYLAASVALSALGILLLVETLLKLLQVERTTIGGVTYFDTTIWAGWPMLAALAYSAIPSVFLGRAKLKLAPQIHDKILYADALMMKADWMAESATAVGVLGVGFGIWWLDPVAAAVVSGAIIKDGAGNVVVAARDLMGHRPMRTDRSGAEELPEQLRACMENLAWVESASVRLRETGHIFIGEVFLKPLPSVTPSREEIRRAHALGCSLNWRLHDLTISIAGQEHDVY